MESELIRHFMKRYLFNTLVHSIIIGTLVYLIEKFLLQVQDCPTLLWCIVAMFIAIFGLDLINKGKLIFN